MKLAPLLALCLALAGCGYSREVRHEMTWSLATTGLCDAPGRVDSRGQKEVTLRYVKSPDYFEVLCSTKVADHLAAVGKNPVTTSFLYTPSTRGRSLCNVGGVAGTRLGSSLFGGSCTGLGHESGGYSSTGPGPSKNVNPFD